MLRCVGVGKCRRLEGGTMCPSFMVTREEKHSTRGRARLLFEMLRGETIRGGWRDERVKEALDLCLACKGCKAECPVSVDMATYKAEFLAHYWAGRLRPRAAYAFGLIPWWSRLFSLSPRLANFLTQSRGLSALTRAVAGIAPERSVPAFAPETFRRWFSRRGTVNPAAPPVLLFPDTFSNFFHPGAARAAVEVLEDAGFRVAVPGAVLCCGRPLYDYGMLELAKRTLRGVLKGLRGPIREGVPVVVLEPSCAAVFRDELVGLFPTDEDARRLCRQTHVLSEFLMKRAPDYRPPRLERRAIVQGHCHQTAIMKMTDEEALLREMGIDAAILDSGCCGMAGSFGFERGERYEVSRRCGERVLLPEVRRASRDTLVIADGFSCREQIRQGTGREALHLAEVLELALRGRGATAPTHLREEP
jgi:Fe-S oxidoreductase